MYNYNVEFFKKNQVAMVIWLLARRNPGLKPRVDSAGRAEAILAGLGWLSQMKVADIAANTISETSQMAGWPISGQDLTFLKLGTGRAQATDHGGLLAALQRRLAGLLFGEEVPQQRAIMAYPWAFPKITRAVEAWVKVWAGGESHPKRAELVIDARRLSNEALGEFEVTSESWGLGSYERMESKGAFRYFRSVIVHLLAKHQQQIPQAQQELLDALREYPLAEAFSLGGVHVVLTSEDVQYENWTDRRWTMEVTAAD